MYSIWKDLVFGVRTQMKSPGVTALAVVALAFGIAATSVSFSFVNSLLLRPLPVKEPARLVRLYSNYASGPQYFTISYPDYEDLRDLEAVFSGVLVDKPIPIGVLADGKRERVWGYLVSSNYFSLLGVKPALGRFFAPEEGRTPGANPLAIISYSLWQRAFAGQKSVLGETLRLNSHPFRVIGVAPENFHGVNVGLLPDLWLPVMMEDQLISGSGTLDRRGFRTYFVMGRLRVGVTVDEARSAVELLARQLQQAYPTTNEGIRFTVLPEAEGRVHPMVRGGFLGFSGILSVVAVLVLLLASSNVAGILLIRAVARRREIGIRLALGSSRTRIIRQLLTEATLLSVLAGVLGLALAWMAIRVLLSIDLPTDIPVFIDLRVDSTLLGFSLVVMALTGVLFGLAPALQASKIDLAKVLKDSGNAPGLGRTRLRAALVALQISLSTMLVIGAGLFVRSLQQAHQIDLGFDPEGVVMTSLDLGLEGYKIEEGIQFWNRLVDRMHLLPGTQSVSLASTVPFELNITRISVAPQGYQPPPGSGRPSIDFAIVDKDYFQTLGIALLEGRDFRDQDDVDSPPVVIINDLLARQFWPNEEAVGNRVVTREGRIFEVVGVVKGGKYLTLGENPKPYIYLPFRQSTQLAMTVLVRCSIDPADLLGQIRREILAMDDNLPQYNVKTMREHLTVALIPATLGATVLGIVSTIALILASLGLYGMLAYAVEQRTYEIGVRRALGAENLDVIALVVRQAMTLVFLGLVTGIVLSLLGARVIVSLLYGVQATDPFALGLACLVLAVVSLLACYVPAYRATRIQAVKALRYE